MRGDGLQQLGDHKPQSSRHSDEAIHTARGAERQGNRPVELPLAPDGESHNCQVSVPRHNGQLLVGLAEVQSSPKPSVRQSLSLLLYHGSTDHGRYVVVVLQLQFEGGRVRRVQRAGFGVIDYTDFVESLTQGEPGVQEPLLMAIKAIQLRLRERSLQET